MLHINTGRITDKHDELRKVQTTNGSFRRNIAVRVPMKTCRNTLNTEALVHGRLPENLLSATPIIKQLGETLLDKRGAALIPRNIHRELKKDI